MDIRDLQFWYRQSLKKRLNTFLESCQAVRIGMATKKDYKEVLNSLQTQLRALSEGKAKVIKENWESLKNLKR